MHPPKKNDLILGAILTVIGIPASAYFIIGYRETVAKICESGVATLSSHIQLITGMPLLYISVILAVVGVVYLVKGVIPWR